MNKSSNDSAPTEICTATERETETASTVHTYQILIHRSSHSMAVNLNEKKKKWEQWTNRATHQMPAESHVFL